MPPTDGRHTESRTQTEDGRNTDRERTATGTARTNRAKDGKNRTEPKAHQTRQAVKKSISVKIYFWIWQISLVYMLFNPCDISHGQKNTRTRTAPERMTGTKNRNDKKTLYRANLYKMGVDLTTHTQSKNLF